MSLNEKVSPSSLNEPPNMSILRRNRYKENTRMRRRKVLFCMDRFCLGVYKVFLCKGVMQVERLSGCNG